jgi:multidrug efflux pump subunit AcrB
MEKIIEYFSLRPVVVNVILFGTIAAAVLLWSKIGKEEMPELAFNWVSIAIPYPGASSGDVELFVTKPIEEKLKGISGLEEVQSTSSYSMSSFRVTFEMRTPNLSEKIQEVKDAVDSVDLPRETREPSYRQFKTSEKSILDIGLYLKDREILDVESRMLLQKYALTFKDRMLSLPEVSGLDDSGYLRPELKIKVVPGKLDEFELSMAQIQSQVAQQHLRNPLGNMADRAESDVSLVGELDDVASLKEAIVSSGFDGQLIRLSEVAIVEDGFERTQQVIKVSGREGVLYNVKKSSSVDILSAQKAIFKFIEEFKLSNADSQLGFVLMDDESFDVRNRLSLIAYNGLIGFLLIIIVLFLFLDVRAGIWVGMGIPFCLAVTLIIASLIGFTVNNITLAAIIIVLGIVVDDAIIVAENISRREMKGMPSPYVQGTREVMSPILASVLTTCAAFIPLYFFSGRFGLFVQYIPTVVFLMLLASLLESFFILPAHMRQAVPSFFSFSMLSNFSEKRKLFLDIMEIKFSGFLEAVLKKRIWVLSGFLAMLIASFEVFDSQMSYVMFPREETKDFRVRVKVPEGSVRYETARLVRQVEDIFLTDAHGVIVGVRSSIGQSSRGGQVNENEATLIVEVIPRDERRISLNELFVIWQKQIDQLEGFEEIRMVRSRWGAVSGSAIEIQVQENNDYHRNLLSERLKSKLESIPALTNVEIEKPVVKPEYQLTVNKREASRLNVDYNQLASTLRAYIEGTILYTLNSGEEEVDVRFTSTQGSKDNIEKVLSLSVANKEGYLIPVRNIVTAEKLNKPASIQRINFKRTTSVFADLNPEINLTPLEVAEIVEATIFPEISKGFPSAVFRFEGEVKESRESQADFMVAILMALLLIYLLLVFLFESLITPLIIAAIIPFGMVGVVFMFWTHGMTQFGFFAVVGALGMIGVVLNDSIVLVDKMESNLGEFTADLNQILAKVAEMTATRLRAVMLTTITTVAGLVPTAYGLAGYDAMLAEMMLSMCWGLLFGMFITLVLTPSLYSYYVQLKLFRSRS